MIRSGDEQLIEQFRYNAWATLRLIEFCEELDPQMLETPVRGGHGTVKDVLANLVGMDEFYLAVVEGAAPRAPRSRFTSLDDLYDRALRLAERWERRLQQPPHPERLVEIWEGGEGRRVRVGTVLAQVLAHGGEQRTRVVSALEARGVEVPPLDAWTYGVWLERHRQQQPRREAL
ncbi:MAG TPA: DinB family protein [Candidatus Dormibacteraeota bacterium]|jgi:uncharacterized damage-inducible protein DinB|nr:DinB family protein [Candidatus Dormibacteraeota bacterium]